MSTRTRSARRFALNAIIATSIAVALLLLIEGAWRVAGRLRTGTWPVTRVEASTRLVEKIGRAYRRHPYYLVGGRPGAQLEVLGHEIHFDRRGYRGFETALPKPAGRYRILCVGGSTTFDLLAADDSKTWPARLAHLLSADNVDVVNAGFAGWTTTESLISLELRDVDVAPDLVVIYAGLNDLQPASHRPFARDYSVGHAELLPRVLGVESAPLRFTSRFVFIEWLLDRMSNRASRPEGFGPAWNWTGGDRRSSIPAEAIEVYERNMRSTIAIARAHGARVLLVPQRVFPQPGSKFDIDYLESWAPGLAGTAFVPSLARFAEVDRKLAASGVAALADPFQTAAFSRADFGDPMHFNAEGSAKFATEMARAIRELRSSAGK